MKFTQIALMVVLGSVGFTSTQAQAFTLDLIEGADDPVTQLINGVLKPGNSGITVTGGQNFVGRIGDGVDPNTAQSALYSDLNLVPNNPGLPTISNMDGIFLTSGVGNLPSTNTDTSFDHNSVGLANPGTGGDADLSAILAAAGAPSSVTNDVNFIEFDFTVDDPSSNAVSAQFVFGSDEFPDQGVTDVFAFIVDGVNYAMFPDGSLVSFVQGANAGQFVDNDFGTGNYDIEYDGFSRRLNVVGLLDPNLSTHTIKIAIADTSDTIFDSGVFIGGLMATQSDEGGIVDPETTPEPTATLSLLSLVALCTGSTIKRKIKQK